MTGINDDPAAAERHIALNSGGGNFASAMAERHAKQQAGEAFPTSEEGAKYAAEHPEQIAKLRETIAAASAQATAAEAAQNLTRPHMAAAVEAMRRKGELEAKHLEGFTEGFKACEAYYRQHGTGPRDIGAEAGRTSPGTLADAPPAEAGATPDQGRVTNDLSNVAPNDYLTCACGKDFGELGKLKPTGRYADDANLAYCADCKPADAIIRDVGLFAPDGNAVYLIRKPKPGEDVNRAKVGHFADALMRLARPNGKAVQVRDVGNRHLEVNFHLAYPLSPDELEARREHFDVCQKYNEEGITEAITHAVREAEAKAEAHFLAKIENLEMILRFIKLAADVGAPYSIVAPAIAEALKLRGTTELEALVSKLSTAERNLGRRQALQSALSTLLLEAPSTMSANPESHHNGFVAGVDKCIQRVQQLLDKARKEAS